MPSLPAEDAGAVTYLDDMERAKEFAAQAIRRMDNEHVPPTPENFSVWYAYYGGRSPDLRRAIDILASNHQSFTQERLEELQRHYLGAEREEEVVRSTGDRIQGALGRLLGILESASGDTGRYGAALEIFNGRLHGPIENEELRALVTAVAGATDTMVAKNRALEAQLAVSSEQLSEMRRNLDSVKREALTDALTGIYNRKYFDGALRTAAAQAMENDRPMSLLMIDIDHFKLFNDTHGHVVGDHVLALVARTLTDCVKGRDTVARYGGEEFSIILPDTRLADAIKVAEQVRITVAARKVINRTKNQTLGAITLSIGAAQFLPGEPLPTLVQRADEGLYTAKRSGRNRVVGNDAADALPNPPAPGA